MIFETLTGQKFPETYNSLQTKLESKSFFLSQIWFDNFLQTVVPDSDTILWFGCKTDTGEPLFLWPLWVHQSSFFHPTKMSGLANYYTTRYEPLHAINNDNILKEIITITAQRISQQSWDYIDLYPLNPKAPIYSHIVNAFQQLHRYAHPYFIYGNWFLLTNKQTFEEYFATRPSILKNTITRRLAKLKKYNTVEFRTCTNLAETEFALRNFQKIYARSWKKIEPYPEFIPGIVKAAAKKSWLRVGLLSINHEVVAVQIWFSLHQTAYIYKLCHDSKFNNYSPGSLLTAYLMEYVINVDKVTKIDFLSGDDTYKKDWMSHREECWGLQITNPRRISGFILTCKNLFSSYLSIPSSRNT
tara:strand:+ start:1221 stop:2294 length:1074 start_codon:yes stop_codon:yes gene_type:complete